MLDTQQVFSAVLITVLYLVHLPKVNIPKVTYVPIKWRAVMQKISLTHDLLLASQFFPQSTLKMKWGEKKSCAFWLVQS